MTIHYIGDRRQKKYRVLQLFLAGAQKFDFLLLLQEQCMFVLDLYLYSFFCTKGRESIVFFTECEGCVILVSVCFRKNVEEQNDC